MNPRELSEIVGRGETKTTEFKRELNLSSESEKKEFVKDLSAMANSINEEGYIIYGLDEDGQLVGIERRPGLEESLIQIASSRINPPVDFEPIWSRSNGVSILLLRVPKSSLRPHSLAITRDVYIRRGVVVERAHSDEIIAMKFDRNPEGNHEIIDRNAILPQNSPLCPICGKRGLSYLGRVKEKKPFAPQFRPADPEDCFEETQWYCEDCGIIRPGDFKG